MNDPGALVAFFAAIVVVWAAFLALIVVIVTGRMRERAEHLKGLAAGGVEHAAHRDEAHG